MFVISVTNEVPEQPVISPLSGAIFERRIIEKYILENGCDPITGKELKAEELIEIKSKFSRPQCVIASAIEQILSNCVLIIKVASILRHSTSNRETKATKCD